MRAAAVWMVALALAGGGAAWGCVDREIVKTAPVRSLTPEEIVAGLASPVFRDVLAARAQLLTLADGDWLTTLRRLSRDPSPQKRLLAITELSKRSVAGAREVIRTLSDDPDEAVRAEARARLADAATPGGVP